MKNRFEHIFSIHYEREDFQTVTATIEKGILFKGTNLWILIFAILIASLGLNVNSTAVIIGAMLISPLMGPIMGIGLSMGINDISLLQKALFNYGMATLVALCTSTLFFLLSPLDEAHSEILARTSPTIYDVLIAFFGGLAGIVAICSQMKGNVLPGVAIATALMPPLCTAGYGLASWQFHYFFGAFYLFIINTVFIALATLLTVRILHFPQKHLANPKADRLSQRIIWVVAIITIAPSIYFGYDMVQNIRFTKEANTFISREIHFTNDYLLNKQIEPAKKKITLVFGGSPIPQSEIIILQEQLKKYRLQGASLEIKQGFSYLDSSVHENSTRKEVITALEFKIRQLEEKDRQLDSLQLDEDLNEQVFQELKTQLPGLQKAVLKEATLHGDTTAQGKRYMAVLYTNRNITHKEQQLLANWLAIRLKKKNIQLIIQK